MAAAIKSVATRPTPLPQLHWLTEVREAHRGFSQETPVWVRHGVIRSGPPMATPERHPFCEISFLLRGRGVQLVEGEQAEILKGDLFLCGADVPHLHRITQYPHAFTTIYFLPQVFIGAGPAGDGLHALRRFTAKQPLGTRLIRPPVATSRQWHVIRRRMEEEFDRRPRGWQMGLQAALVELVLRIVRWEEQADVVRTRETGKPYTGDDWRRLDAAIGFITRHFAQPLYASQVAAAAGVSETTLKALFRRYMGTTWVRYQQGCRVRRASEMLAADSHNVTDAAMATGFESLSHFNAVFRRFTGLSPKAHQQRLRRYDS